MAFASWSSYESVFSIHFYTKQFLWLFPNEEERSQRPLCLTSKDDFAILARVAKTTDTESLVIYETTISEPLSKTPNDPLTGLTHYLTANLTVAAAYVKFRCIAD
jgi:hypothetical protein